MKQLKFMLAAATAIGLATAAQAARFSGSTDFEGDFDLATEFTYSGTAGDNESAIIPGVPTDVVRPANHGFTADQANVLQVNTGTEPIVRSVDGTTAGASLADGAIYIDTLVQFTVTPKNDPVTATPGVDKLMIYLKEGDDAAKLRVKACTFAAGDILDGETCVPTDVEVSAGDLNVEAGKWYRLTVKSYVVLDNLTVFEIFINGTKVSATEPMYSGAMDVFPSLLGRTDPGEDTDNPIKPTLKAVGFAGEGKVDDLVITTFDPTQTVVDFTLALDDAVGGINGAVTYSCGAQSGELAGSVPVSCYVGDTVTVTYALKSETEYSASWTGATVANNAFEVTQDTAGDTITLTISKNAPSTIDFTFAKGEGVDAVTYTINDNEPTAKVKAGDVIKITDVDYADLYVAGSVGKGYTKTISADEVAAGTAISVTVDAKPLTGEGAVEVPDGTKAENIGINTETTGLADASATELTAIVKWADTYKATGKTALDAINDMVFDGKEPKNDAADAFLLNCDPNDADALKAAKDAFKFDDFDASKVETWLQGAIDALKAEYPNGNVVPQRAQNLGAWYGDDDVKPEGFAPKFFRAKLIRK